MVVESNAGYTEPEDSYDGELKYLYKRLATVDNLIRVLEEYSLLLSRPAQWNITEKQPGFMRLV